MSEDQNQWSHGEPVFERNAYESLEEKVDSSHKDSGDIAIIAPKTIRFFQSELKIDEHRQHDVEPLHNQTKKL